MTLKVVSHPGYRFPQAMAGYLVMQFGYIIFVEIDFCQDYY